MKIAVLTDNTSGPHTPAEHGLSYYIEYDRKKLLFDTGQSDMFLRNAEVMKINLKGIDAVILSHGHFDHGNGLEFLKGGSLICHPGCFSKRYRKSDRSYIGLRKTEEEIAAKFQLNMTSDPLKISENIWFLGEVPRVTSFESESTQFVFEDGTPDYVVDDSAVVLKLKEGLFVITGCGHSGIVNTLEHAKKVTGIKEIYGIMGGFHLKEVYNQLKETTNYLKTEKVMFVIPSHCTGFNASSYLNNEIGIRQIKTGDVLEF